MKYNFYIFSIKKYFFTIMFSMFLIFLIFFSESNVQAAKDGLVLFWQGIIPSLFPFFVASDLLCKTKLIPICKKIFGKFMKPIFKMPGDAIVAIIIGTLSGYPVGAKIVCNLYEKGSISTSQAEKLLAFCNNSGPLFIIGTVGIALFKNRNIGILLLITHFFASLSVGILFRFWNLKEENQSNHGITTNSPDITLSNLGKEIGDSIKTSIVSVLQVGGFIILFSVIISIIENLKLLDFLDAFNNICSFPSRLFTKYVFWRHRNYKWNKKYFFTKFFRYKI